MVSERDIQSYLSTKTERAGDRYDREEGENYGQTLHLTAPPFPSTVSVPVAYCRLPC